MKAREWLGKVRRKVSWFFCGKTQWESEWKKYAGISMSMYDSAIVDIQIRIELLNERYTALDSRLGTLHNEALLGEQRAKDYAKRLDKKVSKDVSKINNMLVQLDVEFGIFKNTVKKYDKLLNENIKKVDDSTAAFDNVTSMIRKEIGEFDSYKFKYNAIESLHERADVDYDKFLKKLEVAVTKFQKSDAAIERLARLEERITLMEITNVAKSIAIQREQLNNGSGQDSSRSIRPD
jgi:predicted  nucleic acid-binding Zn-ribbon protein